ncbi:MAG: cytochrome c4 [Burkholderiales bacterium]|nr:cytochrome c4 [Burkholderiales bacterium]
MIKALTLLVALAGLAPLAQAQDASAGQKKAAMCMGCHAIVGYQTSFPQVYKVPKIAGQNAKYLAAALAEYKSGNRKFPTMRAVAASLSDKDMADLAAFFSTLGESSVKAVSETTPAEPPADVAALIARGACTSCHGPGFNKPIDAGYPKLAGQYADYLSAALVAYQTQGNPQVGRGNAIMGAQVKQFTHAELRAIADYVSSLHGDIATVPESRFR